MLIIFDMLMSLFSAHSWWHYKANMSETEPPLNRLTTTCANGAPRRFPQRLPLLLRGEDPDFQSTCAASPGKRGTLILQTPYQARAFTMLIHRHRRAAAPPWRLPGRFPRWPRTTGGAAIKAAIERPACPVTPSAELLSATA